MNFYVFFFSCFLTLACLSGQSNIAIGEWKSHLPQQSGRLVTQSESKIIYATEWNLISIDKDDLSADFMSKVDGLSEVGISLIKYDMINKQLIVIYNDSNIDIINNQNQIINIPNLKSNTTIIGDKRIYDVEVTEDGIIFFATGFGIIELNGQTYNFGGTTITNARVNALISIDNTLYAGLEDGLYQIVLNEDNNVSDFGEWTIVENKGIPSLEEVISIASDGKALYVGTKKVVYKSENLLEFEKLDIPFNAELNLAFINYTNNTLTFGYNDEAFLSQYFYSHNGEIIEGSNCSTRITDAIIDQDGRIWFADGFPEIRYAESMSSECKRLSYNSPFHHSVGDLFVKDGSVFASDGGVSDNFQYLFSRNGFYIKDATGWTNYNEFNTSDIADNDLLSFYRIVAHPRENIVYVGSYWGGLLEFNREDDLINVYNQENSSLTGAIGDEARERTTGIAVDKDDNLWVTTYGSPKPIHVRTPEGEWHSFSIGARSTIIDMLIDDNGYLWCTIGGANGGVYVYDPGSDINSIGDDRQIFLNSNNTQIPTDRINTITEDLEGQIWVGSSEGPIIFDCGLDLWEGTCEGVRRIVLEDEIAAFLLADQDIISIEVDGANRKWFGTRNGLFVQSANGEDQILRFSEENSPLFDDFIRAMAFDGDSGEMYIGTDRGIISYRTQTTEGSRRHRSADIYAYPNPVPPEYDGPIAIKGLLQDAEIKITDINGRLIVESISLGGQAIWDGRDVNGSRVASGVYLVFSSESSSFNNPDAFVTKILVLN